jgi:hypothetical protein
MVRADGIVRLGYLPAAAKAIAAAGRHFTQLIFELLRTNFHCAKHSVGQENLFFVRLSADAKNASC